MFGRLTFAIYSGLSCKFCFSRALGYSASAGEPFEATGHRSLNLVRAIAPMRLPREENYNSIPSLIFLLVVTFHPGIHSRIEIRSHAKGKWDL
jgi:hypothetical protein